MQRFSPNGVILAVVISFLSMGNAQPEACTPTEEALAYWRTVKSGQLDGKSVDELAPALEACLASPDPELRDGIGYELFTGWLRGGSLSETAQRQLVETLQGNLSVGIGETATDSVFLRSFSALILTELVRADAQEAFLGAEERHELLEATVTYLEQERDLRGLDAELGWVHGVAHASDILWRLALHPETTADDHRRILEGVLAALQKEDAFYAFNEGDRLARAAATVMSRDLLPPEEVSDWLRNFARPANMASWSNAFATPSGMAELHNTKLFVRALESQLRFTVSAKDKEAYLNTLQTVLRVLAGTV